MHLPSPFVFKPWAFEKKFFWETKDAFQAQASCSKHCCWPRRPKSLPPRTQIDPHCWDAQLPTPKTIWALPFRDQAVLQPLRCNLYKHVSWIRSARKRKCSIASKKGLKQIKNKSFSPPSSLPSHCMHKCGRRQKSKDLRQCLHLGWDLAKSLQRETGLQKIINLSLLTASFPANNLTEYSSWSGARIWSLHLPIQVRQRRVNESVFFSGIQNCPEPWQQKQKI